MKAVGSFIQITTKKQTAYTQTDENQLLLQSF